MTGYLAGYFKFPTFYTESSPTCCLYRTNVDINTRDYLFKNMAAKVGLLKVSDKKIAYLTVIQLFHTKKRFFLLNISVFLSLN